MSRGFGLVAKEDIPAGGLIIEYCGEMITDAECTRRLNETELTGNKEYYFFKIADDLVIDAGPIGNNARFLNHSCDPNCKTELWQIGCQKRVGIFTLRDVPKGTELTYDYNFEGFWQPGAALKCYCGSSNCAGTLGGKKKTKEQMREIEAAAAAAEAKKNKPSATKKTVSKKRKVTAAPSAPTPNKSRDAPSTSSKARRAGSESNRPTAEREPSETETESDDESEFDRNKQ